MAGEMRPLRESGFEMSLPCEISFRFCEMPRYKKLYGAGSLKEMDIGWWDEDKRHMLLIELGGEGTWKKFEQAGVRGKPKESLVNELAAKFTDSLLMLAAAWAGTEAGQELKESLPRDAHAYPGTQRIRMIFLLDTPSAHKRSLLIVRKMLKRRLEGKVQLWGLLPIEVIDYDSALKLNLPISRSESDV